MMNNKKLKKTLYATRTPSLAGDAFKRFLRNKAAVVGAVILLVVLFMIIFANVIVPPENVTAYNPADRLAKPSAQHLFGADNLGRDVFARVLYGARITVGIGVGATLAALILGAAIASICALFPKVDVVLMRIMDVWSCIPSILLALVFLAVMGGSVANMMFTLTIVSIPAFTLHVRSVVLSITEQDYVKAARLSGVKGAKLVFRYILPNAIDTIIVDATMTVSNMMLSAAGLSAIGMGVAPPSPEWGAMLNYATDYYKTAPHLIVYPAFAIILTALAINLVGDGLRDALDPKSMK